MERKTFILKRKREFRRAVKIFSKNKEGKFNQKMVKFTTEHKVSEKERNRNARNVPAEYNTTNEVEYDAMLRSGGYGKTFVLVGDPEAKLKREPFDVTPLDAKKMALKNLFEQMDFEFDTNKSVGVLEEEFRIQVSAKSNVSLKKGKATKIPHAPVDLNKERTDGIAAAQALYVEKYGEEVPEGFANDTAFLDGLSNPNFDAKKYIAEKEASSEDDDLVGESIEVLREKYFEQHGKQVATAMKNNAEWIKSKLA